MGGPSCPPPRVLPAQMAWHWLGTGLALAWRWLGAGLALASQERLSVFAGPSVADSQSLGGDGSKKAFLFWPIARSVQI